MPMLGVHKRVQLTANSLRSLAATDPCRCRALRARQWAAAAAAAFALGPRRAAPRQPNARRDVLP